MRNAGKQEAADYQLLYFSETVEDGVIIVKACQAIEACLDSWKSFCAQREGCSGIDTGANPVQPFEVAFKSGQPSLNLTNKQNPNARILEERSEPATDTQGKSFCLPNKHAARR